MMSPTIPSAIPTMPRTIAATKPDGAAVRMATVASISPTELGIRVTNADTVTPAGWVQSYKPLLGDVVAVSRQGANWVVLGSMGTTLDESTAVRNYNFSLGVVGSAPPNWGLVSTSGSPALTTEVWSDDDMLDDRYCCRVAAGGTGTVSTQLLSDPIAVGGAEQWVAGAWVRTGTDFAAAGTCSVQLIMAWYGDDTLGSFVSEVGSTRAEPVARGMDWRLLRVQKSDGVPVPSGAGWLRVKLLISWNATVSSDAFYVNRVIARRVG